MCSNEAKSLSERLKKQGVMHFCEEATPEQITSFESSYSVSLPQKLKEWFAVSDGGDFFLPAGFQLYGVAHAPIIDVNDKDKPNDTYIVIGALSYGDPVLCEKGSERISIYNHEAGRIENDEIYPDFTCFLNDLKNILGIGG